jgi:hypothetical protein
VAWAVVAALTIVLNLLAIPSAYGQFKAVCPQGCDLDVGITPRMLEQMQAAGVTPDAWATYRLSLMFVFAAVYIAISAVLFFKRPNDRAAQLTAIALTTFGGISFLGTTETLLGTNVALDYVIKTLDLIGQVSFFALAYLFPNWRFAPGWTRWIMGVIVLREAVRLYTPGWAAYLDSESTFYISQLLWVAAVVGIIVVQVYRYRKVYTPVQRQQTKWAVSGFVVGIGGFIGVLVFWLVIPPDIDASFIAQGISGTLVYIFMMFIPISIGVAMLRSRLYEIDVLINRSLVYGSLTLLLGSLYVGGVVGLQALFRPIFGSRNGLVIVISTLAIAALFMPLRNALQRFIDRRFYRHRYDAVETLERFSATVREEVDLDRLAGKLVQVVEETMQPAHASIWLRDSSSSQANVVGRHAMKEERA